MIRPTPSSTRSDPLFPYPTLFRSFPPLSAAVRYERYEGLADVASPKLGLVYRPIPSITIKGGWGKSFKAPTFYQRYKVYQAILLPASSLGGAGAIAKIGRASCRERVCQYV